MKVIAQNAAAVSAISESKSIFLIDDTINNPTYISAGVVANPGIARNTGEKNSATANITADVTAVRPVLPPAATPALDSTYEVTVEVPTIAPNIVPNASARRAPLARGRFPFSSRRFPLEATPISVPTVSNKSTNRNENVITKKLIRFCDIQAKSNCPMCGADGILKIFAGTSENAPAAGSTWYQPVFSAIIPRIHVMRMPHRTAPGIFLRTIAHMQKNPIIARTN